MVHTILRKGFSDDYFKGKDFWTSYILEELHKTMKPLRSGGEITIARVDFHTLSFFIPIRLEQKVLLQINSTGIGYAFEFQSEDNPTENQKRFSQEVSEGLRTILYSQGGRIFGEEPKRGEIFTFPYSPGN